MIHENSLEAYFEEKNSGRISTRAQEVFNIIKKKPGCTARQILFELAREDPNYVRPRITELKKKGLVVEGEKVKDEVTGKSVATFHVNPVEVL